MPALQCGGDEPAGAAYRFVAGRAQVENVSDYYELTDESQRASAETRSGALGGMPVLVLGRPGMHGSYGDHARDRHTPAEVELVDAALTELRRRYGFQDLVLLGFSSGGVIVADLLARRSDVRCAVMGSAPLDLAQYYRRPDGSLPDYFAMRSADLADPRAVQRCAVAGVSLWRNRSWQNSAGGLMAGFPGRQTSDSWDGNRGGGCRDRVCAAAGLAGGGA